MNIKTFKRSTLSGFKMVKSRGMGKVFFQHVRGSWQTSHEPSILMQEGKDALFSNIISLVKIKKNFVVKPADQNAG